MKFNCTPQIPLPTPIFPQLWCGAELGWEETTWGPPTPGCRPESDCERGERGEPSPSVPLSLSRAVRGPGQARPPCDCESSVLRWQQISRSSFSRQLWNKISDHVEITGQHAARWVPPGETRDIWIKTNTNITNLIEQLHGAINKFTDTKFGWVTPSDGVNC